MSDEKVGDVGMCFAEADGAARWIRDDNVVLVDTGSDATVEKVAAAMHAVEYGTYSPDATEAHNRWTWQGSTDDLREPWRMYARAALAALRDGA